MSVVSCYGYRRSYFFIEIISEVSSRLPDEIKARHPEIPWPKVAGIGKVLRHDYQDVAESHCGLGRYFPFYNEARPHQALGYRTPHAVYFDVP